MRCTASGRGTGEGGEGGERGAEKKLTSHSVVGAWDAEMDLEFGREVRVGFHGEPQASSSRKGLRTGEGSGVGVRVKGPVTDLAGRCPIS